jgi:hypothetical protein
MTYCIGIALDAGLVLASDSRTHTGVDAVWSDWREGLQRTCEQHGQKGNLRARNSGRVSSGRRGGRSQRISAGTGNVATTGSGGGTPR